MILFNGLLRFISICKVHIQSHQSYHGQVNTIQVTDFDSTMRMEANSKVGPSTEGGYTLPSAPHLYPVRVCSREVDRYLYALHAHRSIFNHVDDNLGVFFAEPSIKCRDTHVFHTGAVYRCLALAHRDTRIVTRYHAHRERERGMDDDRCFHI